MVSDDLEWDSFDDPDSEGFIGYLKTFYQQESAFGTPEAIQNIKEFYRIFFRPPIVVKFETFGQPMRALDIVVFNNQPLRVMKVDSVIDPKRNIWWQNLECEWMRKVQPRN